jgi:peptidoglycan/LPS O-acetylase OafA/YrhL
MRERRQAGQLETPWRQSSLFRYGDCAGYGQRGASVRFRVLDSWRGLAALCVALFHFPSGGALPTLLFVKHSWLFVDFFFVLSGFVIAHAYEDRIRDRVQFWVFMVRRLGRLWPLHIVMLAILVIVEFAKVAALQIGLVSAASVASVPFTGHFSVHDLISSIFLAQAVMALANHWGFTFIGGWNEPSWTISVELVASLAFAVACLVAPRRLGALAALGVVASFLWLTMLGPGTLSVSVDFGSARALLGFCTGYLVFRLFQARRLASGFSALEAGALAAIIAIVVAAGDNWISFLALPVFAFAVYVFAHEGGILSRALSTPAATRLGDYSYSIYLTHYVIIQFIFAAAHVGVHFGVAMIGAMDGPGVFKGTAPLYFGAGWITDLAAFVYLALVIVVSSFTYRWIETPARDYVNRASARWSQAQYARLGAPAPERGAGGR